MLTRDGERLLLLEGGIVVDRSLPKYARREASRDNRSHEISSASNVTFEDDDEAFGISSISMARSSGFVELNSDGSVRLIAAGSQQLPASRSWWTRINRWIDSWSRARSAPAVAAQPTLLSVEAFFQSLKSSTRELEVVDARRQGYLVALHRARVNGQTALIEQLTSNVDAVRAETQLVAIDQRRFLDAASIVEFAKQSQKGLRLDYVRNFTRQIPVEVSDVKRRCDELEIFDNYAILHYDPQGKSWAQTEAEKEEERRKRADPILFGLIHGRDRLYFVGACRRAV